MTRGETQDRSVRVLVLTGYGINCDFETAYAFELAGGVSTRVHINALVSGEASLRDYDILVFDGGFSWGDDHGAGVLEAVRFKSNIGEAMLEFIWDVHYACQHFLNHSGIPAVILYEQDVNRSIFHFNVLKINMNVIIKIVLLYSSHP